MFDWLHLDFLKKLQNILPHMRFIGGCVRDSFINPQYIPRDMDFATSHSPDEVKIKLENMGYRLLLQGYNFGTVGFVKYLKNPTLKIEVQITTLRMDTNCDGRKAKVEHGFTVTNDRDAWFIDTLRRDLTINALALDWEGNLYDYHHGLDDLKKGVVKFIGPPQKRIEEDYLRILRYFRFFSKYSPNHIIDAHTLRCLINNMPQILKLSSERINQEFFKILNLPLPAIHLMSVAGFDTTLFNTKFDLLFFNFVNRFINIYYAPLIKFFEVENFNLLKLCSLVEPNYFIINLHKIKNIINLSNRQVKIILLMLHPIKHVLPQHLYTNFPSNYGVLWFFIVKYYKFYANKPNYHKYYKIIYKKILKNFIKMQMQPNFNLCGNTIINYFLQHGVQILGKTVGLLILEAKILWYSNKIYNKMQILKLLLNNFKNL